MNMDTIRKVPKLVFGTVCKKSMQKSATLRIDYMEKHGLYKKYLKRSKTLVFHDENDECEIGDQAYVMETRALSKTKRHRLVKVASK